MHIRIGLMYCSGVAVHEVSMYMDKDNGVGTCSVCEGCSCISGDGRAHMICGMSLQLWSPLSHIYSTWFAHSLFNI